MALLRRARAHALRPRAGSPAVHGGLRRGHRATALVLVVALLAGSVVGSLAAVVGSAVSATPASAAACKTWIGTGTSARFHDAANWSPAGVPTATDCVLSGSTQTDIVVDADATVTSWDIGSGIKDLVITNNATFRLADTSATSRLHAVTGQSGRFLTDNASTAIGELTVLLGETADEVRGLAIDRDLELQGKIGLARGSGPGDQAHQGENEKSERRSRISARWPSP